MLTNKVIERVELPHEPGQWVELRKPSLGILHAAQGDDDGVSMVRLLTACIKAWSYDEPVTEDNVWELDSETAALLVSALKLAGDKADEKNS